MFCSKLNEIFSIFLNLLIIFSLIDADTLLIQKVKIIIKKNFFIKEHLFFQHDLLY